ncbi:MAG: phospho-N-acetylmuramoyl-pentapeptide-transferase [Bacteroidales bacterium]|jgi:phospho-N-acetylmuramoyl-pentapeptide-transferase|nr:phospho-N-acetylmuramoyl-pentapeptide-transferase [Bacteroidales bacterium]
MFYYLFSLLDSYNIPGSGVFEYISFRSGAAFITSLLISILFGKSIIRYLQKKQIGEVVRDLGLQGQIEKKGTPTMGGILIIIAIIIPTVFFAKLSNVYILLMLFTTIWFGILGYTDDYIKVFKKNKEGLPGKYKIFGQIFLGLIVGLTLYLHDDVVVVKNTTDIQNMRIENSLYENGSEATYAEKYGEKSTKTTIPFMKNNEFDYKYFVSFLGEQAQAWGWIVFVFFVILITTSVSNGVNLTDGLDGLATGTSSIVGLVLGILAYLSGHVMYSEYLNIMYIPHSGELVVFASALIGATIGFWWYNSYPAQIFMGDTGSLTLGGIIAVFAILIRKELLIPILCGIFFMESISVILQVSYFKYTKRKYGEGKRIFLMSPLHHHYQKKGIPEAKIVARFWIIGLILAAATLITLKIR